MASTYAQEALVPLQQARITPMQFGGLEMKVPSIAALGKDGAFSQGGMDIAKAFMPASGSGQSAIPGLGGSSGGLLAALGSMFGI